MGHNIKEIIADHNKKEFGDNFSVYKKFSKSTRISISQVKDSLAEEFDKQGVAEKTYNLHFDDKESIYYQKTVDEIIAMWEAKADKSKQMGSLVDDWVGLEYKQWLNEDKESKEEAAALFGSADSIMHRKYQGAHRALEEFKKNGLFFEAREMPLYLRYPYKKKIWLINGRFDAIFSNDKQLLVVDWKNSEEIKDKNPYKKMLGPCKEFDDCDLIKFTIQVYMYIYILRKEYGITLPMSSCIVQFPGEKDYYYKMFMPAFKYSDEFMEKIIEYSISKRIEETKKKKEESY